MCLVVAYLLSLMSELPIAGFWQVPTEIER
ncbi:hypothetical protein L861_03635 [Litchfieldella anticariensis FP35 = DSM 16096]|uniref:Uncharacterized protein n=1 Tax=Litchfieldella anticariensis (strain DSM 16096 / CECT 5854 / CIP 108499 / LMG 22089 / FP35) TaxID=1121939 RepID=S2KQU5_LITA3|nr:hypothetical protein L861_03635 [Halomonas anticariensis FP35 = DSM 16096]